MPALKSIIFRYLLKRKLSKDSIDRPISDRRKSLDMLGANTSVAEGTQIEPTMVCGLPAEWIIPETDDGEHVLLYLHGGGYTIGSCASHRPLASQIAKVAGARVLLPEYRLAPENLYPAAVEDATAVYHQLLRSYSPDNIAIAGDSAGGGLTLATLLALKEQNAPLPKCAVTISAWTDLLGTGHSMQTRATKDPWLKPDGVPEAAKFYYGSADPKDPKVSPLYGDFHGFPPLLMQVGDYEILLNDSTRVAQKAQDQGVDVTLSIWDGMWHVWHAFFDNVVESRQAIDEMGQFLKEKWIA